ncbi:predicted protein [Histoplasma capsulatum H143]|uniref:Uncharacterized protein n=1 Tax=Ajellomyces capsulatus (strain H143) TaxID=544712 RepID=C6HSD4_AJECH|nr:predicted protein [Histoplasma capsulatum H143]
MSEYHFNFKEPRLSSVESPPVPQTATAIFAKHLTVSSAKHHHHHSSSSPFLSVSTSSSSSSSAPPSPFSSPEPSPSPPATRCPQQVKVTKTMDTPSTSPAKHHCAQSPTASPAPSPPPPPLMNLGSLSDIIRQGIPQSAIWSLSIRFFAQLSAE